MGYGNFNLHNQIPEWFFGITEPKYEHDQLVILRAQFASGEASTELYDTTSQMTTLSRFLFISLNTH
jgi:hypothetical protein